MEGDVRSSSDDLSDSSVDNPNKAAHLQATKQNGTPKKNPTTENGVSHKVAATSTPTEGN